MKRLTIIVFAALALQGAGPVKCFAQQSPAKAGFHRAGQDVIGTWSFDSHEKERDLHIYKYKRVQKPKRKISSYNFEPGGKVIVRTNASGCAVIGKNGKQKIFTKDAVNGTWKKIDENTIQVKYETFVGKFEEEVTIVDDRLIKVKCL